MSDLCPAKHFDAGVRAQPEPLLHAELSAKRSCDRAEVFPMHWARGDNALKRKSLRSLGDHQSASPPLVQCEFTPSGLGKLCKNE